MNKQTIIDNNARIDALTKRLNNSTFADVRDTTATAGDVASGKIFYDKDGLKTIGTGEIKEFPDMLQARVDATNSCKYLFYYYNGTNVDFLENLDTSSVTDMTNMFSNCSKLITIPLLDTRNVTNMYKMFQSCNKLTEIPQMDTSKVTNMANMFQTNSALTSIPQLDTSSCTDMNYMFESCSNITTIPQLDTINVTNMSYMFKSCSKLTEIPQMNTSKVTNMYEMFSSCKSLTTIPQLDTSKVSTMQSMFRYCESLTTIPKLDTRNVYDFSYMFYDCKSLTKISELDMIYAGNLSMMFANCTNLTNLTLKNIKKTLQIGSGTSYGTLLTDESIINTAKELWDLTGATSQKLTLSTTSNARLDAIYVKLVDVTDEMIAEDEYISNKKPCVVCESTDTGAMTLREYVISKNWQISV